MNVVVRKKKLKGNRSSLYLDVTSYGKRRKEYLKMYVYNRPRTENEREHNTHVMALVNKLQLDRLVSLNEGTYGVKAGQPQRTPFFQYFEKLAEKRKHSNGNCGNWNSVLKHLRSFAGIDNLYLDQIDEKWLDDFKYYLLHEAEKKNDEKISVNSAASYFQKVIAAMRKAYQENLNTINPADKVDRIKPEDTHREFLTLEELKKLAKTPFELISLRKAALFSCLTGLRWSDIEKLQWKDIMYSREMGHFMRFKQQKSKTSQTKYLSEQVIRLLGDRGETDDKVFPNLVYSTDNNKKLRNWVKEAGIDKYITFHCFRHTYATIQLTLGTDIYVLSKELGHKDLKTTEVYAKIVDQRKREAANKIPDLGIVEKKTVVDEIR